MNIYVSSNLILSDLTSHVMQTYALTNISRGYYNCHEFKNKVVMPSVFYLLLQTAGASEASVRNLPPSAISYSNSFDARGLVESNKGRPMEAIVEQVRDGSTVRVYLLPEFQFVQVLVAGIHVQSKAIALLPFGNVYKLRFHVLLLLFY